MSDFCLYRLGVQIASGFVYIVKTTANGNVSLEAQSFFEQNT